MTIRSITSNNVTLCQNVPVNSPDGVAACLIDELHGQPGERSAILHRRRCFLPNFDRHLLRD